MDSQPLSLEDSGRLRVLSAKVYSVVRNRHIEHFEKVLNFLEETYRLLPRLVAPIKHMKIVFGLKTMLVMWMLKEGRGIVDTMFKINQFFPSRLPQYQNQCNQREIFLMKKNHLDFKDLAQSLAMDKGKLERYVASQMQQQYGEHYAQKVEDRLLQYLQKLETVLPGDPYIDKLLRKESPMSEEEKLLLEVISSDSATIATTLQKLLHCEVTMCHDQMTKRVEEESCDRTNGDLSQGSSGDLDEAASSPHFCSKHQRWVKSILQECPEECSDDLLRQANAGVSPPLFQSSSSRPSSQDLTPSDLIPRPADQQHPALDTSDRPQTPGKTCERAKCKDELSSGWSPSPGSSCESQPLPQPDAATAAQRLSPKVQVMDVLSGGESEPSFQLHKACPNHSGTTPRNPTPLSTNGARTSPRQQSSGDGAPLPGETVTPPGSRGASTSVGKEPSLCGVSSTSAGSRITRSRCHGVPRAPLRLSLPSQAVLLQPRISLCRLSSQRCQEAAGGSPGSGRAERAPQSSSASGGHDQGTSTEEEEGEEGDSSFDLNLPYSSRSSSSGAEDSTLWDPDYEPRIKKKRLLLEREATGSLL